MAGAGSCRFYPETVTIGERRPFAELCHNDCSCSALHLSAHPAVHLPVGPSVCPPPHRASVHPSLHTSTHLTCVLFRVPPSVVLSAGVREQSQSGPRALGISSPPGSQTCSQAAPKQGRRRQAPASQEEFARLVPQSSRLPPLRPPQTKEKEEQERDSAGRTALSVSGTSRPRVHPIPSAPPSTSGLGALGPSGTAEPHGKIRL